MKLLRVIAVFLLGFFLAVNSVLAADFPRPKGFVNDFAEMFSASFRQDLEVNLQDFEKETTTEISVVTIESLDGGSIEDIAVRLFEEWGIGKKDQDNGLLILIAENDRKMRIEVGYGLEPIITDGRAGRVIREQMSPAFKKGDFESGTQQAVLKIQEYIQVGEPPVEEETEPTTTLSSTRFFPFIFGAIMLIYISSFLARSKRIWPGALIGAILGLILAPLMGAILLGLLGLFLDLILSRNYKKLKKRGRSTSFWGSRGGFSSGGRSSGGSFGGFGGGSSGGGGSSSGW